MSSLVSALLCALVWTIAMLFLAAPIGPANIVIALIAGALAGGIWYEERVSKLAMRDRDAWNRGEARRYAR